MLEKRESALLEKEVSSTTDGAAHCSTVLLIGERREGEGNREL